MNTVTTASPRARSRRAFVTRGRAALISAVLTGSAMIPVMSATPASAATGGGSSDGCSTGIRSIDRVDATHLKFRFAIWCDHVPYSTLRIAGTVQRGSTVVGIAQNNTCAGLSYCYSFPVTVYDPAGTQTYYTLAEGHKDQGPSIYGPQTFSR